MKPFAETQQPRQKLPMYVVSGLAVGFLVWYLDLVPRFLPVPTGHVHSSDQSAPPAAGGLLSPAEWDDVVDHGGSASGSVASASPYSDPLLRVLNDDADPPNATGRDGAFAGLSEPNAGEDFSTFGHGTDPNSATNNRTSAAESRSSDLPNSGTPATSAASGVVTASGMADASGIRTANYSSQLDAHTASPIQQTDAQRTFDAGRSPRRELPVLDAVAAGILRSADEAIDAGRFHEAHRSLSEVYWNQPELRPHLEPRLAVTARQVFTASGGADESTYFVRPGDTLSSIAQQFQIPWQYLAQANRIQPEELQAGQTLHVVQGPFGAVVERSRFRLTVHAHGWYVNHYEIGVGRDDSTPTGEFTVQDRLENPVWYNPDGGTVGADDPQNPLGEYWLGLGNHIGIHGTIDPSSIGRRQSRGCIHLAEPGISEVFRLLSVGSPVMILP